jgi:WD40 repeat protein
MCCLAFCHWLLLLLLPTQVCWSPFSSSHFLTASADWSVRLWSEAQSHSLWTFQLPTAQSEVSDEAFCPAASTLFAAATGNTLQLWDIEGSVMAPRAMATRLGVRLTALAFSQVGG